MLDNPDQTENPINRPLRKEQDLAERFNVSFPRRPQDASASTPQDYFYIADTASVSLYGYDLPAIDFHFGSDTLLEDFLQEDGSSLTRMHMIHELTQMNTRLLNWDSGRSENLIADYWDTLAQAKRVAYITCHGTTAGDEGDQFWALSAIDVGYGANRVIKSIVDKGVYDLVVIGACNPDGLPLEMETDGIKSPHHNSLQHEQSISIGWRR